jgi:uncharacterized protein YbaR (Trm112 family)
MHIKLECPRCKQSLSVPKKKAGGYVQCPRCKGSLWVSENLAESADGDQADGSLPAESVAAPAAAPPPGASAGRLHAIPLPVPAASGPAPAAAPMAPPPPPPPPSPSGSGAMPSVSIPRPAGVATGTVTKFRAAAAPPQPPGASPAAGTSSGPPPSARKTARFITAAAAQSAIKVASDGKLPELHLLEGNQKDKADAKGNAVSPLMLVAALVFSVGMSMALVLMPSGSEDLSLAARRANARQDIADKYFSDLDPKKALEPYQILLREAQAAYSRGDRAAETGRYRRVLDMLRREHGPFDKGLTGSPSRDKELEEQLTVLLGG